MEENYLFVIILSKSFLSDVLLPYNMPPSAEESILFDFTSEDPNLFTEH